MISSGKFEEIVVVFNQVSNPGPEEATVPLPLSQLELVPFLALNRTLQTWFNSISQHGIDLNQLKKVDVETVFGAEFFLLVRRFPDGREFPLTSDLDQLRVIHRKEPGENKDRKIEDEIDENGDEETGPSEEEEGSGAWILASSPDMALLSLQAARSRSTPTRVKLIQNYINNFIINKV